MKWVLNPLYNSAIDSLYDAVIPVSLKISCPILGSAIPNKNFYFLELFVDGRCVVKKFLRVNETLLSFTAIIFSRASSAVLND